MSDDPGAAGGQVGAAPALPLPCGMAIAPEYSSASYLRASLGSGKVKIKGKKAKVPVDSSPGPNPCQVQVKLLGSGKGTAAPPRRRRRGKKSGSLGKGIATIAGRTERDGQRQADQAWAADRLAGSRIRVEITTVDATGNTVQTSKVKLGKQGKKGKKKHKK